jgi:hypothetical protein
MMTQLARSGGVKTNILYRRPPAVFSGTRGGGVCPGEGFYRAERGGVRDRAVRTFCRRSARLIIGRSGERMR